jgi:hypothetical protein
MYRIDQPSNHGTSQQVRNHQDEHAKESPIDSEIADAIHEEIDDRIEPKSCAAALSSNSRNPGFRHQIYELHIDCWDRIGMICDISSALRDHDINIIMMGTQRISKDFDLIGDGIDNASKRRAFIHLRIAIPQQQIIQMPQIHERLSEIDSLRELRIKQWNHASTSTRISAEIDSSP